jgi:tetratricopeptide (TPR) repeat protein
MKETAPKPVEDEVAPLVIGGEATKPARQFNKKRFFKIVAIVVGVLLVAVTAVAIWWIFIRQDPNYLDISKLDGNNPKVAQAQRLAKQTLPKDPKEQALQYGIVGAYLDAGKQYTYAEHYYLTAQKIVDDHKLDTKEVNFYQGLADVYKAMGNKQKADEYDKKAKALTNDLFKGVEFDVRPR